MRELVIAAVRELVTPAPVKRAVSVPAEALRIGVPILRLRLRGSEEENGEPESGDRA